MVIYAIDINKLARRWAKFNLLPLTNGQKISERFNAFLKPGTELFKDEFPANFMQFFPHPGKHNRRMQLQQGALLYDTMNYKENLRCDSLDDFIDKYKEPPEETRDSEPTLFKVLINKKCTSDVFAKLELMGISAGSLYMSPEGVAKDIINSYNYIPKVGYLREDL